MFYVWGCVQPPQQSPLTPWWSLSSHAIMQTSVMKYASASAFGLESLGHCHGLLSATWHTDSWTTVWFSGNCSLGLLYEHDRAPMHYWEDDQQWLNMTYPGRWTGCLQVDCMASLVARFNSDWFLPVEKLWRSIFMQSLHNYQRSHAKASSSFNNMLGHAQENAIQRTAACVKMDGGHFEYPL
jgi:hypothetical protein